MAFARDIDVRLRLLNARTFRSELAKSRAEIKAFGDSTLIASDRMAKGAAGLRAWGGAMTRHVTLPIAAASIYLAKYATDFQQQMTLIGTQTGASTSEVQKMTGAVQQMAIEFGQSPIDMAKALYHIESIGQRGPKALDTLHASAEGSAVGLAHVEDVASALAGTWLAQVKGVKSTRDAMGWLTAAVGVGNIRMQDMVAAIGTGLIPTAKTYGLGLQDIIKSMAILTDEAFPPSSAARLLRTSFHYLIAPGVKATAMLDKLGIKHGELNKIMHEGPYGFRLSNTLSRLARGLRSLPGGITGPAAAAAISDIIPAGRGVPIPVLLNQLNRFNIKGPQAQKVHDRFMSGQLLKDEKKTAYFKFHQMLSQLQVAMIRFGNIALPVLLAIAKVLTAGVNLLAKLPKPVQKVIVGFALLLAATGPVVWAFGVLVGSAVKLWSGVGKTIQAFIKLGEVAKAFWSMMTRKWVEQMAMQQRDVESGRFLPIGPKTKFGRMLMSNSKWTGAKMGLWMGSALAAAIAGWEIGKWLRAHVPVVRSVGNWIGKQLGIAIWGAAASPAEEKKQDRSFDKTQGRLHQLDRQLHRHIISWQTYRRERNKAITALPHLSATEKASRQGLTAGQLRLSGGYYMKPQKFPTRGFGGTISSGGDYLVGERGPEAVTLPPGARVQPLSPTIAAAFGQGTGDAAPYHFHLYIDGKEVNAAVTRVEKRQAARK